MIIRGHFKGDAPYFAVHLLFTRFQGHVWFLADTGASRSLLSPFDAKALAVRTKNLEPAPSTIVGIGGSVPSFRAPNVRFTLDADDTYVPIAGDLFVVDHNVEALPPDEIDRIMRIPSILGRDILNRFRFTSDYRSGIVRLEQ